MKTQASLKGLTNEQIIEWYEAWKLFQYTPLILELILAKRGLDQESIRIIVNDLNEQYIDSSVEQMKGRFKIESDGFKRVGHGDPDHPLVQWMKSLDS